MSPHQDAIQDKNQKWALIAHSGTAGTAVTRRVVATSAGALSVDVVSGEIIASLGTVNILELGTVTSKPYAIAVDGTTTANTTYVGQSAPGSSGTALVWQIKRIDESVTSMATITYADGDASYDNAWDNRGTMSYS